MKKRVPARDKGEQNSLIDWFLKLAANKNAEEITGVGERTLHGHLSISIPIFSGYLFAGFLLFMSLGYTEMRTY